jgi:signal transduction histidine kinase
MTRYREGFVGKVRWIVTTRQFWVVAIMLAICTFFHYFSPERAFGPLGSFPLTRQAIVRIIFLLPVSGATFAFGRVGGLVTLAAAVLAMLPRVFLMSDQPLDALFETAGITVVGAIIVWIIQTQEHEKRLRQKAVEELKAVNAIVLTLSRPYDLDAMLGETLDRVLDVVGSREPRGAIFLLDPWRQMLHLRAYRGLSEDFVEGESRIPLGECLCGLAANSGDLLVVGNALEHPRHTRCPIREPHAHVCIPLRSRDRLLGVMDFQLGHGQPVDAIDYQMFNAIGRQIGVAVENARLCENLRFYVRKITDAQEDERKRIARELHDDTAQGLVDLVRRLDVMEGANSLPEPAAERLEDVQRRIEDLLQGVRRFIRYLRPSVLDDLGLLPALEGLLADMRSDGLGSTLETQGEERRLPPDVELALFRIVQEALTNVRRHAEASKVVVRVEHNQDSVHLTVTDDGQGFEPPASMGDLALVGKFGFLGMHERAQLLRGSLVVHSELGSGTTVAVEVPVSEA